MPIVIWAINIIIISLIVIFVFNWSIFIRMNLKKQKKIVSSIPNRPNRQNIFQPTTFEPVNLSYTKTMIQVVKTVGTSRINPVPQEDTFSFNHICGQMLLKRQYMDAVLELIKPNEPITLIKLKQITERILSGRNWTISPMNDENFIFGQIQKGLSAVHIDLMTALVNCGMSGLQITSLTWPNIWHQFDWITLCGRIAEKYMNKEHKLTKIKQIKFIDALTGYEKKKYNNWRYYMRKYYPRLTLGQLMSEFSKKYKELGEI